MVNDIGRPRLRASFLEILLQTARVNPRHLRAAVEITVYRLAAINLTDHWRVRLAAALGAEAFQALLEELGDVLDVDV